MGQAGTALSVGDIALNNMGIVLTLEERQEITKQMKEKDDFK